MLLAKYPGQAGCIVESDGGDREFDLNASSSAEALGEVINLCDDEEESSGSLKRKAEDGDEGIQKRAREEDSEVIIID
jgi:hypothetical protein